MKIEINKDSIIRGLKFAGKYIAPAAFLVYGAVRFHKQEKRISELEGQLAEKDRQNRNLSRENNNLAYQTGKRTAELEAERRNNNQ